MPNDTIPLPEPVYYQWRRKNMPWSLEFAFSHMCHATTEDSEIRTLHPGDQMHAHAAAVSAAKDAEIAGLRKQNASQSVHIISQTDRIKVLERALERTATALNLAFSKKPLRDMEETLAEASAALGDKT